MSKQRVYINSVEFQPNDELILVKPVELKKEEVTMSGIIVSTRKESVIDKSTSGVIISIGKAVNKINDFQIGDTVFWPNTDGIEFEFEDGDFLLLRDKSILGTKKK